MLVFVFQDKVTWSILLLCYEYYDYSGNVMRIWKKGMWKHISQFVDFLVERMYQMSQEFDW